MPAGAERPILSVHSEVREEEEKVSDNADVQVKMVLKRLVVSRMLRHTKGIATSSSFRLSKLEDSSKKPTRLVTAKPKKVAKPKRVNKPKRSPRHQRNPRQWWRKWKRLTRRRPRQKPRRLRRRNPRRPNPRRNLWREQPNKTPVKPKKATDKKVKKVTKKATQKPRRMRRRSQALGEIHNKSTQTQGKDTEEGSQVIEEEVEGHFEIKWPKTLEENIFVYETFLSCLIKMSAVCTGCFLFIEM